MRNRIQGMKLEKKEIDGMVSMATGSLGEENGTTSEARMAAETAGKALGLGLGLALGFQSPPQSPPPPPPLPSSPHPDKRRTVPRFI